MKISDKIIITAILTTSLFAACKEKRTDTTKNQKLDTLVASETYNETPYQQTIKHNTLIINYLDSILINNPTIPEVNQAFLKELIHSLKNPLKEDKNLAFDKILSPFFTLSSTKLGIFGFPIYLNNSQNKLIDIARESRLIPKNQRLLHDSIEKTLTENNGSVFPVIYLYTPKQILTSHVKNLYYLQNDCLSYYRYSVARETKYIDAKVLIGSWLRMNLNYQNFPEIDALIQKQAKKEKGDCPDSYHLAKTFAQVKGVDNLYFIYADTFPFNNKLDTPMRALVLKMENKIIYVWSSELDLFGCSCL